MKHVVRSGIVAAGLVTSTVIGATQTHAYTAATFTGEATITSFGTGQSTGTASLCVNGLVANQSTACFTGTNATATFSLDEPMNMCPVIGNVYGRVTVQTVGGSVSGDLAWTRAGTALLISVIWDNGELARGEGTFMVTSHVGNPCGKSNVKATVSGSITT